MKTFIRNLLYSTISLININIKILFLKLKKKKIILFYHTEKESASISLHYINFFFLKKKNYEIFHCHISTQKNTSIRNYYFLKQKFLKYIFGINIYICTYVSDVYPYNCKKIYIHHDIYDTPLVDQNLEKKLFIIFSNFDFIFTSSKKLALEFKKKFEKYCFKNYSTKIIKTGYLKLQYLFFKKKNYKIKNNNNIIIAPSHLMAFKKFNCAKDLVKIISILLKKTEFNIYLRFHPSNYDHFMVNKIILKFAKFKRFFLDTSSDYFDSYINSKFMITDLSGTAYTYAFLTKNPVIFFSRNESELLKDSNYKNLDFFKNRKKIGRIVRNTDKILYSINSILRKKINYSNNIKKLLHSVYDDKKKPFSNIFSIIKKI